MCFVIIILLSYSYMELDVMNLELKNEISTMNNLLERLEYNVDNLQCDIDDYKLKIQELNEEITIHKETITKVRKENSELRKKLVSTSTVAPTRGSSALRTFEATGYCSCIKCCGPNAKGITATGTKVQANRTIAVDPKVIPLGSKVKIEGLGTFTAEDTGSAVKGNIVDIYFGTHQEALNWGRRKVKVSIIK